jgi:hypothetical protein
LIILTSGFFFLKRTIPAKPDLLGARPQTPWVRFAEVWGDRSPGGLMFLDLFLKRTIAGKWRLAGGLEIRPRKRWRMEDEKEDFIQDINT